MAMTKAVKKALQHEDKLGAGAKKREKLKPSEKVQAVMAEWKRGTLHSGSGEIVKSQKQAVAIALSEAREKAKKKRK